MRALFFDEDSARAVAGRLVRDGYAADVRREAFAGEDDDADHPWAVSTDAPESLVDALCREYDGWPDVEPDPGAAPPPFDLPAVPRRKSCG